MRRTPSYLLNAAFAGCVLSYALHLSRGDGGPIDWAVIALGTGALLLSLARLGERLHRSGGRRALWHLQRTLLFWVIGLFNTVLARPADIGNWKNLLGWVLIALAAVDSVALYRREQRAATPARFRRNHPRRWTTRS